MLLRLKNEFADELVRLPNDAAWWSLPEKHDEGRRYLLTTLERRGVDTAYYRSLTQPKLEAKRKWWHLWT